MPREIPRYIFTVIAFKFFVNLYSCLGNPPEKPVGLRLKRLKNRAREEGPRSEPQHQEHSRLRGAGLRRGGEWSWRSPGAKQEEGGEGRNGGRRRALGWRWVWWSQGPPANGFAPLSTQRGNPVLRFVRNVPWEFGDVLPDYVLGQSTCALFLR